MHAITGGPGRRHRLDAGALKLPSRATTSDEVAGVVAGPSCVVLRAAVSLLPLIFILVTRAARVTWGPVARAVIAALLAAVAAAPRAWDTSRMMAAAQAHGGPAVEATQALLAMAAASRPLDEAGRLNAVNRFFNQRMLFRDDLDVWGLNDHWASPMEALAKGAGDCEDYAIAKYFTLVALGVPTSRLRLVYVSALIGGPGGVAQAHMVLAYYPPSGGEPLIADNLVTELRPASRRPDLTPVFSFNGDGLWQGAGSATAAGGDPVARLSRWREVLAKARAEGFL
jgi:predicted transglutaminase-like cysteine proteinase